MYFFGGTPINLGMQTILHTIPNYLTALIEALRTRLRDPNFLARHRVRPQDFSRQRQLTFPVLMLFVLQQTVSRSNATCTNFSTIWRKAKSLNR